MDRHVVGGGGEEEDVVDGDDDDDGGSGDDRRSAAFPIADEDECGANARVEVAHARRKRREAKIRFVILEIIIHLLRCCL